MKTHQVYEQLCESRNTLIKLCDALENLPDNRVDARSVVADLRKELAESHELIDSLLSILRDVRIDLKLLLANESLSTAARESVSKRYLEVSLILKACE